MLPSYMIGCYPGVLGPGCPDGQEVITGNATTAGWLSVKPKCANAYYLSVGTVSVIGMRG